MARCLVLRRRSIAGPSELFKTVASFVSDDGKPVRTSVLRNHLNFTSSDISFRASCDQREQEVEVNATDFPDRASHRAEPSSSSHRNIKILRLCNLARGFISEATKRFTESLSALTGARQPTFAGFTHNYLVP